MKAVFITVCIAVFCCMPQSDALAWGTWGHNYINKGAILALPPEMGLFFYRHSDFIVQESTVPDLRKYTLNDKAEHPRHYINVESYGYPEHGLPLSVDSAIAQFGKEHVDEYGILPWYMEEMMKKLTEAFRKGRKTEILFLAADLGHYAGDAHVPLHTTKNHNGQLTGQQGIHAFWESQLPELFGDTYNLYAGEATYISDIRARIHSVIDSSFALLSPLLSAEKSLSVNARPDELYAKTDDGKLVKNRFNQPVHTTEYAQHYHMRLNGMVEAQLRHAIRLTADLWYTAWVNAGKPKMSFLDGMTENKTIMSAYKRDMTAWKKGKITNCHPEVEFPGKGN